MSQLFNNLIGGEWVAGAEVSRNINPSNNDDVIGEYSQADAAQVEVLFRRRKLLRQHGPSRRRSSVTTV